VVVNRRGVGKTTGSEVRRRPMIRLADLEHLVRAQGP
jgi:hypothetical protein